MRRAPGMRCGSSSHAPPSRTTTTRYRCPAHSLVVFELRDIEADERQATIDDKFGHRWLLTQTLGPEVVRVLYDRYRTRLTKPARCPLTRR